MKQFHQPTDEKRMVAILPAGSYQDWIGGVGAIEDFMLPFDADKLQCSPETPRTIKKAQAPSHPSLL
jgi:hypothetical protein